MTRLVQMRLPDDLVARVDEVAGPRGRTEFTIRALEAALDPDTVRIEVPAEKFPPKPSDVRKPETRAVRVPDRAVEAILGALPGTVRQIAQETGFFEGRVEKEVRSLEKAGLVRWVDGMVERV